ncbi:MAG: ABC transporter substrate-binding protein [Candidatus Fusobacterium pullicola]|uniref:ABC transporter substrate-binding protein n=1 Tax=Candidatus Fusobacterium pullicola TaxID=2838601 RepID=A0A9E2KX70_9FUSO|nr:ABC transporter substrate-binding protein [Fusobacterium mortiferum]MBU3841620.1 ABC transporter substrate-binding protein [Candidatus Fusobacterium pullicola]
MLKKNLLILFILLSLSVFAETIKVVTPDGLPALSLVNMMDTKKIDNIQLNYKVEKMSDALIVDMLKREGDIAIVPSNFSAQLYNKKLGYKILGTIGWGSFYVVSRDNINSLEELKGKEVYTFGKGLTPDLIFQSILEKKGINKNSIKINYLSSGNEVASLYLGKKVDTIVIPEPMLSKVLSKSPTSTIVANLNDEWKNITNSDLGYPQSTLVIKEEIYETNPKFVKEFINKLTESISKLYKNSGETVENVKRNSLSIDTSVLDKVLTRANIFYTPIIDCKEEYNNYFKILELTNKKVIGGKLPDEEIFAK